MRLHKAVIPLSPQLSITNTDEPAYRDGLFSAHLCSVLLFCLLFSLSLFIPSLPPSHPLFWHKASYSLKHLSASVWIESLACLMESDRARPKHMWDAVVKIYEMSPLETSVLLLFSGLKAYWTAFTVHSSTIICKVQSMLLVFYSE